jgi:hypothetical protein
MFLPSALPIQDIAYDFQQASYAQQSCYEIVSAPQSRDALVFTKVALLNGVTLRADTRTVKSEQIDRSVLYMQINEISEFQKNWDGYGALSVSKECVDNALSIIASIPDFVPSPDVFPNSNGTITFEWETKSGTVSIEVGDSSYSSFVDIDEQQQFDKGEFDLGLPTLTGMALLEIYSQQVISEQKTYSVTIGDYGSPRRITA